MSEYDKVRSGKLILKGEKKKNEKTKIEKTGERICYYFRR